MRIGLFTALYGDKTLDEVIQICKQKGITAIELGVGAYPGNAHINVSEMLASEHARKELKRKVADAGLIISAFSVHGNPIHPDKSIAAAHHDALNKAIELCDLMDVRVLNGFSGCPGEGPNATQPNWVTCAWPDEFRVIAEWQWNEVVVPYWSTMAAKLKKHNVRMAFEMHPGFVVYNNYTLLKLREKLGELGQWIGANFDPSHLWWQGVDPILAVRELAAEKALFHVHAKDTSMDPINSRKDGNLDYRSYGNPLERSWVFRTVGFGHSVDWWKEFVSQLRTVGYDYVLSIEHEDILMSRDEGLSKAVDALKQCVINEPAGTMFWAAE